MAVIPLALQAEGSTGKAQMALLSAINTTTSLFVTRPEMGGGDWLSVPPYKAYEGHRHACQDCDLYDLRPDYPLGLAVRSGLTLFVRDCVRRCVDLKRSYRGRALLQ